MKLLKVSHARSRIVTAILAFLVVMCFLVSAALAANWIYVNITPLLKAGCPNAAAYKKDMGSDKHVQKALQVAVTDDLFPQALVGATIAAANHGTIYAGWAYKGAKLNTLVSGYPKLVIMKHATADWAKYKRIRIFYTLPKLKSKVEIKSVWYKVTTTYQVPLAKACANLWAVVYKVTRKPCPPVITPSPSPSPTCTPTTSPSPSPSPTCTSTPTPSPSPSPTCTSTPTPSPSPTCTHTPCPTPSPSPTCTSQPCPSHHHHHHHHKQPCPGGEGSR